MTTYWLNETERYVFDSCEDHKLMSFAASQIIEQAVARVAPKSLAVRTRIANTLQTEGTL